MGDVAKAGRTVIFVSHNMAAIRNLCNVAHLLSDGKLIASGETGEVIRRYLAEVAEAGEQNLTARVGDGRIRFTEFRAAGTNSDMAVMCGSEARFEIKYPGTGPLHNVHISMGFFNMYGDGAAYASNDLAGRSFDTLKGEGSLVSPTSGMRWLAAEQTRQRTIVLFYVDTTLPLPTRESDK